MSRGLLTVALALVAASCQTRAASLPRGPQVVDVEMREYSFEHTRRIERGRVVFTARNVGRRDHELVMVPLPEDIPPIAEQLRGSRRRTVAALASFPPRPPGATGTFAVDLSPGRYALLCFVVDKGDRVSHALRGMSSEFRVR